MNKRLPPDYHPDGLGRSVLLGLSLEETIEFEKLDATLPFDGRHAWPQDRRLPDLPAEARWLELWTRHRAAIANAGTSQRIRRQGNVPARPDRH